MTDRTRVSGTDAPAAPAGVSAEAEALFGLIRLRYADRLTAEELEALRVGVEAIVENARALRAVRLGNADEPFQPFAPYRADP
jgi:hypothetical protein